MTTKCWSSLVTPPSLYLAPYTKNKKASPWHYHNCGHLQNGWLANHPSLMRISLMKFPNFVWCILAVGWRLPGSFANTITLPIDEIFKAAMIKVWIQNLQYLIFHIMINFYSRWWQRNLWFLIKFQTRNMENSMYMHGRCKFKIITNRIYLCNNFTLYKTHKHGLYLSNSLDSQT
jgi:hypothetical protein